MTPRTGRVRRGFLLLEVILALAVFGIAATAFTRAIRQMAAAAQLAQSELRITRILQSSLDEAVSVPTLEEGTVTTNLEEDQMEILTKTEIIDDLENEDGQALQEMYLITVTAYWRENNQDQQRSARTWRYGRMYQQQ